MITVTDGAVPKASVRVIAHDAAGLPIGEALTNASGQVKLDPAPSMITVLTTRTTGSFATPVTFVGVTEGDELHVSLPRTSVSGGAGSYAVGLNVDAVPGGTYFTVNAGLAIRFDTCQSSSGSWMEESTPLPTTGDLKFTTCRELPP